MKTHRQEYPYKDLGERGLSRTKPVLGGLLLGGLIGAGTALLFAPQSGQRTRADIQNKTVELRDRTTDTVKDAVSQVKSKARQVTTDVRDKASELTHRVNSAHDDQMTYEGTQTRNSRQRTIQGL
jgi:gas vesicle protein